MARIRVPLNNFAFGEISPSLVSRTDSPVYQQAAESVKNMFIRAEGGVISRPGTKRLYNFSNTVDTAQNQEIRLEPFIFSDDEKYIVAISSGKLDVFRIHPTTGAVTLAQSLTTDDGGSALPWTTAYVPQLTYAQKGDFMWLCIAHSCHVCLCVPASPALRCVHSALIPAVMATASISLTTTSKHLARRLRPVQPAAQPR